VAEIVIEKAKRLVEHKETWSFFSTALPVRPGYNTVVPSSGRYCRAASTRQPCRSPNASWGGPENRRRRSLTIVATALIDTGSRMDEVIFEEFKGTGNSEIYLDRKLAEKRFFRHRYQQVGHEEEELLLENGTFRESGCCARCCSP